VAEAGVLRTVPGGVLVLSTALVACGSPGLPVEGAWQSNRELTLAGLEQLGGLSGEQWDVLSSPGLFGHVVLVYRGDRSLTVLEGECGPTVTFEVLDTGADAVTLRFFDPLFVEARTTTIELDEDRLLVPMAILDGHAREVFTRVPLPEVLGRYPCIDAISVSDGVSIDQRLRAATALQEYEREEYLSLATLGEGQPELLRSSYPHFGSERQAAASLLLALACAEPPPGESRYDFLHAYRCEGESFEEFAAEAVQSLDHLYALAFVRAEDRDRARSFLERYLAFWTGEGAMAEGGVRPVTGEIGSLEEIVLFLERGGWPDPPAPVGSGEAPARPD
jgi:hypothetical protein